MYHSIKLHKNIFEARKLILLCNNNLLVFQYPANCSLGTPQIWVKYKRIDYLAAERTDSEDKSPTAVSTGRTASAEHDSAAVQCLVVAAVDASAEAVVDTLAEAAVDTLAAGAARSALMAGED